MFEMMDNSAVVVVVVVAVAMMPLSQSCRWSGERTQRGL